MIPLFNSKYEGDFLNSVFKLWKISWGVELLDDWSPTKIVT